MFFYLLMKAFKRSIHALWYLNYPHNGGTEAVSVSGKKIFSFLERFLLVSMIYGEIENEK